MNLNRLIFINNLPRLDVHGLDEMAAAYYIEEFINDNLILKNRFIVIVHGIGKRILMKKTHKLLKKHKNVTSYKLWIFNQGCTVVELAID